MTRTFVVVGHRAVTGPGFLLKDLPGTGGRVDVLLRVVNSAFHLSHGIREDVVAHLVLLGPPDPPKTVRFTGAELRHLNPDERSTAALLRKALDVHLAGKAWRESTPGVHVARRGLASALDDALGGSTGGGGAKDPGRLVLLAEEGTPLEDTELPQDPVVVLSDHEDLTPEELDILLDRGAESVSLGDRAYHGDHCVSVVNWWLDRGEG